METKGRVWLLTTSLKQRMVKCLMYFIAAGHKEGTLSAFKMDSAMYFITLDLDLRLARTHSLIEDSL